MKIVKDVEIDVNKLDIDNVNGNRRFNNKINCFR